MTNVGRFRWVLCGLLFLATTINYVDRQILALVKGSATSSWGGRTSSSGW